MKRLLLLFAILNKACFKPNRRKYCRICVEYLIFLPEINENNINVYVLNWLFFN